MAGKRRLVGNFARGQPGPRACWRLRVAGIVQGVGFRPYVWRLARELGLAGWVRNDARGVEIVVEGATATLATFIRRLPAEAPPLARIDALTRHDAPTFGASGFRILESVAGAVATAIGPDAAVCPACLAELFDPAARRYRHPFITCTHCGPRYTIARRLPYDRANTSLDAFPLCPACAAEYADPADRRFHAEATCCPDCGPALRLRAIDGGPVAGDPVAATLGLLQAGAIVAIKGVGGFHLACDARNAEAVARLRERKAREAKPFAVMAGALGVFGSTLRTETAAVAQLRDAAAPIVLFDKQTGADAAFPGVAPGVGALGVMLPNTPPQWLLFHEAAGRPPGVDWIETAPPPLVLVMTSANAAGEPLLTADEAALTGLRGIADAVLGHDREIVARADDSVWRAGVFIRRGRGFVPRAIRLPGDGKPVIAFGGWFKNTVCLTRGDQAFVSTHVGDLDQAATRAFLDETVERLLALTEIQPAVVAHDRHPDFHSTAAALAFARERGLPAIAVQHHHAHLLATAAEHAVEAPAIGLALDGVGLGDDGSAWGGELMSFAATGFTRLGHLRPLPMPGGDKAAREPWRMAAAVLHGLGRDDEIERRFAAQPAAATVAGMLARGLNCPATSSAGRYFDAAAGLLGLRPVMAYEAQAAIELETLAERHGPCAALPGGWTIRPDGLDLSPLLAALAEETDPPRGAALFHETLAAALAEWVAGLRARDDISSEAIHTMTSQGLLAGGGCFLNRRLTAALTRRLAAFGIDLRLPRQLPPGDGGLALGQAMVARRLSS